MFGAVIEQNCLSQLINDQSSVEKKQPNVMTLFVILLENSTKNTLGKLKVN